MATKSGGTGETVIPGEARRRNAWVWAGCRGRWKSPSYNGVQLSAPQRFSSSAGTPIPPRIDAGRDIRWQTPIPGGRATTGERRVTKRGLQAPAQGPLPQNATKSQCHRRAELTQGCSPPACALPCGSPSAGGLGVKVDTHTPPEHHGEEAAARCSLKSRRFLAGAASFWLPARHLH